MWRPAFHDQSARTIYYDELPVQKKVCPLQRDSLFYFYPHNYDALRCEGLRLAIEAMNVRSLAIFLGNNEHAGLQVRMGWGK